MRTLLIVMCLSLVGCGYFKLYHKNSPNRMRVTATVSDISPECRRYATAYLWYGAAAAGAGFLAGTSGVTTVAVKEDDKAHLGLSITAAVLGAASATLTFLAGFYASAHSTCK